jgi:choline dehydrogenase-like flavoprotein
VSRVDAIVIGSGAGGAVTAFELAKAGLEVVILEEGNQRESEYGQSPVEAMKALYRHRAMTPLLGRPPIGYVEGRCVGGSTEINSGFWHRTPREILLRWKAQFDLEAAEPGELDPHFEWAESMLEVAEHGRPWPRSTELFKRGADAMGWSAVEVPRSAAACQETNRCASGCPTGAKQGTSRRLIPAALEHGARLLTGCRVQFLVLRRGRASGVVARLQRDDGTSEQIRIDADHMFVCCGPTETPALLRRSGVRLHVGNSLRIHPMLKVVARFGETIDAERSVLPLLQVKEFWPEISLGGGYFSLGHAAMTLSENWLDVGDAIADHRRLATFYVAVRGSGRGSVRPSPFDPDHTVLRYALSDRDTQQLSAGLARLATLLLAAGADSVFPTVHGLPVIRSEIDAIRWLDESLPRAAIAATTVHAFSSCPMGERVDRCALDSFGAVNRTENLLVNDASMLPDSPGVNPQGSIMAFARRNVLHFLERRS